MKSSPKIFVSLAGAALLVAPVVVESLLAFRQIEKTTAARKHTYAVLDHAEDVLSALQDAETGERGYALTTDEAFLEPYLVVRDGIGGYLEDLRRLTLPSTMTP